MSIKQLTVFVENKQGAVIPITDILSKNNINIRALSIAETEDFGILRLIVNDEISAEKVLEINANHKIFDALKSVFAEDKEKIKIYAKLLYNQALLIEGMPVDDPVEFSNAICSLM